MHTASSPIHATAPADLEVRYGEPRRSATVARERAEEQSLAGAMIGLCVGWFAAGPAGALVGLAVGAIVAIR